MVVVASRHGTRLREPNAGEDFIRARFPGSRRYWEKQIELDLVAPDPEEEGRLLVAEVKWRHLRASERRKVEGELESKWNRCRLRDRHPAPRFGVFDASSLAASS